LTATQVEHLNDITRDLPETDHVVRSSPDGTIVITVPMSSNDIVLLKLARRGRGTPRPYGDGSP
jgi:xylan 1,4-beta-xylosidase